MSYDEKMNNVAGIWLKGRYVGKMPMYSRPGKIICILKESSAQSMNTAVSCPRTKFVPPWRLAPSYMMTLKPPPSSRLSSSKSHKQKNVKQFQTPYIVSSHPQSSQAKFFARLFTCSQAKLTPPRLHWHTNKHFLYCTFSNSLTNN